MRSIVFCMVAVINFTQIIPAKTLCTGLHELYYNSSLSPTCDVNCQDLQRLCPLTAERAQPGCYCQPNYARNLQQQCIPRSECSRDCFPHERPIVPLSKDCENTCRLSSTASHVNICYHKLQRRCVCVPGYCRNRRGQCQRGSLLKNGEQ